MYRNDLDLLSVPEDVTSAPPGENAPARVLGEIGLVLAVTLGLAAFLTVLFGS
jgi:hypothetical protein